VKSLAPGFLIATPQLLDENFSKTVVLMIEHSDEGSMGLIINRTAPLTFRELGKSQSLKIAASRRDLEHRAKVLEHGPMAVLYAICDRVVDEYEKVGQALEIDVDEVEESVFSPVRTDDSNRIYVLKREIAEVRRAVMPLREPMRKFALGADDRITEETATYFRDVADHLHRVSEVIDNLDGLLSTAFDAHIAQISIQQNDDMRRISASVGLVAAPTLIGSIYGMNFVHMPELQWAFGYPMALTLMALSSLAVWVIARRAGWL
jgi:magnesium transporter